MRVDMEQIVSQIASSVRRLAIAASSNAGSDCYIHAAIAQALLKRLGIESTLVVGFAGWRVGNGDSDIILHSPSPGMIHQPGGVVYHVWLEIQGNILDLTIYSIRQKAAQLDKLDGGKTTVTWCPDYLFAPKSTVSSLIDVIQLKAGMYYYSEEPAVAAKVIRMAPDLDMADVEAAWVLYLNQNIVVLGPNDIRRKK